MNAGVPPPPQPPTAPGLEPGAEVPEIHRRRPRRGLWTIIGVVVVVVVILGAGAALGWFKGSSSTHAGTCPTSVMLLGSGASFLYPIEQVWSASYSATTSNEISYNPAGAGTGITALTGKTVDFAATDEGLTSAQFDGLPSTPLTLPVVGGALAIVVNLPGVTTAINLNGTILADIYLGTVTSWSNASIVALNPGVTLPDQTILPVARSGGAGTTFVITSYMAAASATWKNQVGVGISVPWPNVPGLRTEPSNSAMAAWVNSTAYTIGYVDLADALNTHGALSIAQMENPAGNFIFPTAADTYSAVETIANSTTFPNSTGNWADVSFVNSPGKTDYPLAALSYFLVYQKVDAGYNPSVARAQVLLQWLEYVLSPAQQNATGPNNYVPVPAKLIQQNLAALDTMTFDGATIPACTTG